MAILKRVLLVTIILVIIYLLYFASIKEIPKIIIEDIPVSNNPVRLIIPSIKVDAQIQQLGVNTVGEMEVPSNNSDVGWFKLGPQPGDMGSAVIAGHLNGKNNEVGVFANLDKLKIGDTIVVENSQNKSDIFVVYMTKIYNTGFAPEVFSSSDGNNLNLITCDGLWDQVKQSYSKRLVVFAH